MAELPDWDTDALRRQEPIALALSGREARALLTLLDDSRDFGDRQSDDSGILTELRERVLGLLETIDYYES